MADGNAQADIRGLDVDKTAKGFADEDNVFKRFVINSTTTAREIRWYQKTSGFLDSTDTSGITKSKIQNMGSKARPFSVEQTWTRQTSYVKNFIVESPWLTDDDVRDTDIDILRTNIRDLVRAIERKVDLRIFSVINEAAAATPTIPNPTNVNTTAATQDGWDDEVTGNPIKDLLTAKRKIRQSGYDPEGAICSMNSIEHENLVNFLITVKGSSIPQFSSARVVDGVVLELVGLNVVVTENQTTDYVTVWVPTVACTWKAFTRITAVTILEKLIGTKIRVREQGEAILTDPKAVHVTTDTAV